MSKRINHALKKLQEIMIEELGSDAVAVNIYMSYHETAYKVRIRTAESLKAKGISMRNIKGEFIK